MKWAVGILKKARNVIKTLKFTFHGLTITVVSAGIGFTDVLKLVLFSGASLLNKALTRDFCLFQYVALMILSLKYHANVRVST